MAKKKTPKEPKPKKSRSGPSGPNQTDEQRAERGLGRLTLRVSQSSIDKLTREAERRDCTRGALFEKLVAELR
jgi:hypothetical protein